jgi:glycine cleavage system aminomethyltransferase T
MNQLDRCAVCGERATALFCSATVHADGSYEIHSRHGLCGAEGCELIHEQRQHPERWRNVVEAKAP